MNAAMCMHPDNRNDTGSWPQAGRERVAVPSPIGWVGTDLPDPEPAALVSMRAGAVMMMGDNPALPRMPEKPTLMDFFRLRFGDFTITHLLASAKRALDEGHSETIVMACLLHDISNGCLVRPDHGYWSAQIVAPYVSEEVAWAIKYHQALRYMPDLAVGYDYPENYNLFFGEGYRHELPEYLLRDAEIARNHRWYMTSRVVTINDVYFFEDTGPVDPEIFTDIIGRNWRQPDEGLGHDDSPASHMWRTMIWPNNFL
jgi:HD domain